MDLADPLSQDGQGLGRHVSVLLGSDQVTDTFDLGISELVGRLPWTRGHIIKPAYCFPAPDMVSRW
jgi:hypothetical protein